MAKENLLACCHFFSFNLDYVIALVTDERDCFWNKCFVWCFSTLLFNRMENCPPNLNVGHVFYLVKQTFKTSFCFKHQVESLRAASLQYLMMAYFKVFDLS